MDKGNLEVTPGLLWIKATSGSPSLTVSFYGDYGEQKPYDASNDTGTLAPTSTYQSFIAMWEADTGLKWSDSKFDVTGVKLAVATNDIDVRVGEEATATSFSISSGDTLAAGRVPWWAAPTNNWSSTDNVTGTPEVQVTEANASSTDVVAITDIAIKSQTAGVAATTVQILDGSGGSAVWQMEFDPLYGISQRLNTAIELTAGNDPYIKIDLGSNNIDVNLSGFKRRA